MEEYKIDPDNPELLTKFMRSFWEEAGQRIGKDYVVSEFPLKSEEIKERAIKGEMAIFVPAEVSLVDLGSMFPKMLSGAVCEGSLVVDNRFNDSGWFWVEASIDAPYLNTTHVQLREIFKKEEKQAQSLRNYIVGGQISKILTDKYFDEVRTSSRLLGTFFGSSTRQASFDSDGDLWTRGARNPYKGWEDLGGRSEEVIKP